MSDRTTQALFTNDLNIVDGPWTAKQISGAATTPIRSTSGLFGGVSLTETAAGAITVYDNYLWGDATTRVDITNPAGTTARYTYDGTGTDPLWTLALVPIGTVVTFAAQNFAAANNGTFTVTGAGANYIEVTTAAVSAENDKTIGTGNIRMGSAALTTVAVLKASIGEGDLLKRTVTLSNGLTVVTAAASKLTVYHKAA